MIQDIAKQITGFLTALLLFLGTINIKYEWLNADSINALELLLIAGGLLVYNIYRIYRNHYGFTALKQKKARKKI